MIQPKFAAKVFAVAVALSFPLARAALVTTYSELSAAVAAASSGETIKLAAGTIAMESAIAVSEGITISGGWTDESTRADGAVTTLDGANACDLVTIDNAADETVTFERIVFTRTGTRHAVLKTKSKGDLVFRNCQFVNNVIDTYYMGVALQVHGDASARVTLESCVVSNNCSSASANSINPTRDDSYGVTGGIALRFCACASVTMTNCQLFENSIPWSSAYSAQGYSKIGIGFWNKIYGAVALFDDAPVAMSGCSIRANRGSVCGGSAGGGGIVCLYGACDGSSFDHCDFVGNEEVGRANNQTSNSCDGQGALLVQMTAGPTHVEQMKLESSSDINQWQK